MTRSIKGFLLNALLAAPLILATAASSGMPDAAAGEYKSKAQREKLLHGPLRAFDGLEANVLRLELPPGFVGGKHYHTGDVFVYVESGSFTVEVDGRSQTFTAGQVYQETPNVAMVARNGSTEAGVTIVIFQVGKIGEPMMMKAE